MFSKRKRNYAVKLKLLLNEYDNCLIITVDNIPNKQISEMRKKLHGRARFLFGKNTLIRKIIRNHIKESNNVKLENLMNIIKGNCGLVFTNEIPLLLRKELISVKYKRLAMEGKIAPNDIYIYEGITPLLLST